MRFQTELSANRWLAFFDLLGTRQLLADGRELAVFLAYQQAIEELRSHEGTRARLQHSWFSDTFVIMAPDESGESFVWLDLLSRSFMYFLLQARIPLRGAISCGRVYADLDEDILFGQGLVEAYEYGDGQDWIGLLLCPSSVARLESLGVPADNRLTYAMASVPWRRQPVHAPAKTPACILGNWITVNGQNLCLNALREMAAGPCAADAVDKYARAVEFIERNKRGPVPNE